MILAIQENLIRSCNGLFVAVTVAADDGIVIVAKMTFPFLVLGSLVEDSIKRLYTRTFTPTAKAWSQHTTVEIFFPHPKTDGFLTKLPNTQNVLCLHTHIHDAFTLKTSGGPQETVRPSCVW